MTNIKLLNKKVDDSGLKKSYIAKAIKCSPGSLSRKLRGERDFTVTEMNGLCGVLSIDSPEERSAIFFASEVAKTATA